MYAKVVRSIVSYCWKAQYSSYIFCLKSIRGFWNRSLNVVSNAPTYRFCLLFVLFVISASKAVLGMRYLLSNGQLFLTLELKMAVQLKNCGSSAILCDYKYNRPHIFHTTKTYFDGIVVKNIIEPAWPWKVSI